MSAKYVILYFYVQTIQREVMALYNERLHYISNLYCLPVAVMQRETAMIF